MQIHEIVSLATTCTRTSAWISENGPAQFILLFECDANGFCHLKLPIGIKKKLGVDFFPLLTLHSRVLAHSLILKFNANNY